MRGVWSLSSIITAFISIAASFYIYHRHQSSSAESSPARFPLSHNDKSISSLSKMTPPRMTRHALKAVLSVETPEGDGATVRRSIGTRELPNLTPFLMLDNFRVPKGAGFPDHPHRGMTTLTYLLEGEFAHEDFMGHVGRLGPGDLQFMIAARGIMHAEMPIQAEGADEPFGLQLWIDLPSEHKLSEPSYQELKASAIPHAHPSEHTTIKVVCGTAEGNKKEGKVSSPVRPLGGCWFLDVEMREEGEVLWQEIPVGWNAFIYTLTGSLQIPLATNATPPPTAPYYTTVLTSSPSSTGISLTSISPQTRFFIIAGEPLVDQEVFQHGPFVMDTQEGILEAFEDFRGAKNGFEKARGWRSEIGQR